ncbi:hypothetical protein [Streptomyces tubercidicus]|uniref:DUF308 domain-containing protein n=1 Tax=Streptomyces tubercidicus TaxID=47759 RepID=A0A640V0C6_9ACTN|nr:hypothetical protein [Streptomyces tubercidicus]WAU14649.1 hypothetical protein STRTU_005277 [Streptomyces tubercidicus]GFE40401.1 hypothetical protein Stube_50740 [Streptomyces tubercidicus]
MAERSPRDPRDPLDEEAAWAEIVAGYGESPSFPVDDGDGDGDGAAGKDGTAGKPAKPEAAAPSETETAEKDGTGAGDGPGDAARPGSFVVFAPGVGAGPRSWSPAEASDDDLDETDEGHFTPPEPPPLPQADVTTKFAWLAVIGGPLLLVTMVLLQQPVTWWITVLGIGGFLGGFATLVARMKDDDEDDNDLPGSGAVV